MEGGTRAEAQDLGGGGWNSRGAAPTGGYRSRPTLSPYLDLLRTDSGVLPPSHAFVVPRRRIEQQQSRQWQAIGELKRQAVRQAGGEVDTNYQLLPGDRLYVAGDKWIAVDESLAKLSSPLERILGFTLLGAATASRLSGKVLDNRNNLLFQTR